MSTENIKSRCSNIMAVVSRADNDDVELLAEAVANLARCVSDLATEVRALQR